MESQPTGLPGAAVSRRDFLRLGAAAGALKSMLPRPRRGA
jgi:hypothetical protein